MHQIVCHIFHYHIEYMSKNPRLLFEQIHQNRCEFTRRDMHKCDDILSLSASISLLVSLSSCKLIFLPVHVCVW